jgi:hypothetical protein
MSALSVNSYSQERQYQVMATIPSSATRPTYRRRKNPWKLLIPCKLTNPTRPSKHLMSITTQGSPYFIHNRRSKTPLRDQVPPYRSNSIPCHRVHFLRHMRYERKIRQGSPSPGHLEKDDIDDIVFLGEVGMRRVIRQDAEEHCDRVNSYYGQLDGDKGWCWGCWL